jgi:hypothetical protein
VRRVPEATALVDQTQAVARAIARYALAMISETDVDAPESVERFGGAMAALVAHRASFRAQSNEDDAPTTPLPPNEAAPLPPVAA